MRRVAALTVIAFACAGMALAAGVKKYGKDLSLKETTKVSAIYENPEGFNGKRVKVQGPIVAVCEMKGCWLELGSDKEFQSIRFKVDDGVIVFPMTAKGLTATVEGVVSVETQSVEDQIAHGKEMEKEKKKPFDPKSVKGPKTVILIKGEGAEILDAASR